MSISLALVSALQQTSGGSIPPPEVESERPSEEIVVTGSRPISRAVRRSDDPTSITFDMRALAAAACAVGARLDTAPCPSLPVGTAGSILPMTVNGVPGRLLIDPDGMEEAICNFGFIRKAGLRNHGTRPLAQVGPMKVDGAREFAAFRVNGRKLSRWVRWTVRPAVTNADCVLGPAGLAEDIVRFEIRPVEPGMTEIALPFYDAPREWDDRSVATSLRVARQEIGVGLSFRNKVTILSAPAALLLAPSLGGVVEGTARSARIEYGVYRPVRRLVVQRPLTVGPLSTTLIHVRVDDWGDANGVSAAVKGLGADDILVTGKIAQRWSLKKVAIGWGDLSRCASLVYDKPGRRIVLTC